MPALNPPGAPNQMLVSVPTPVPVAQKQTAPAQPPAPPAPQQQQSVFRQVANPSSLILPYPSGGPADSSAASADYRKILRAPQAKQMQKKSEAVKRFGAAGFDEALHRSVHGTPNSTPALVYADWLEENGKPGIAKAIRLHHDDIARERGHISDPDGNKLSFPSNWYAYADGAFDSGSNPEKSSHISVELCADKTTNQKLARVKVTVPSCTNEFYGKPSVIAHFVTPHLSVAKQAIEDADTYDGKQNQGYPKKLKDNLDAELAKRLPDEPHAEKPKKFAEAEQPTAPTFYSQAERVIKDKVPNQAHPEQIKKTLLNNGVKPEEMKWSGLDDHLAQAQGPIKKEDLLNHVRANNVQLKEVVKGGGKVRTTEPGYPQGWDRTDNEENPTRYAEYQLPGAANYREMLLTLPIKQTTHSDLPHGSKQIEANTADGKLFAYEDANGKRINSRWHNSPETAKEQAIDDLNKLERAKAVEGAYFSSHWQEPNVIAHMRVNDRTGPNGEKLLHVEEIQSDLHQAGRNKGYKQPLTAAEQKERESLGDKQNKTTGEWNRLQLLAERAVDSNSDNGKVPDMPMKRSWHELALRHILRHAAEHGYDGVSWTPGEQQAERYDLSKHINNLYYDKNDDGTYNIAAHKHGDERDQGTQVIHKEDVPASELPDIIGKEVAQKIVDDAGHEPAEGSRYGSSYRNWKALSGLDLKVGGEGMKGFYDKMIPDYLNKYGKKWGAKVLPIIIKGDNAPEEKVREVERRDPNHPFVKANRIRAQYIPITPEMRKSVLHEGQALFAKKEPPKQFKRADSFVNLSGYNDLFRKAAQAHFGSPEVQQRIQSLTPEQQQRHTMALNAFNQANLTKLLLQHASGDQHKAHDVATKMLYGGVKGKPSLFSGYKPEIGNLLPRFASFSRGYLSHATKTPKDRSFTDAGLDREGKPEKATSQFASGAKVKRFSESFDRLKKKVEEHRSRHQYAGK